MSCITYLHNDPFDSGSKFISGTTCNGSALSENLFFGDSQCFESDEPLIICDGLTISGSCDSPVVTPTPSITASPTPTTTSTPTPTITPSSNPFCGEQVIISEGTSNMTPFNGTYDRVYVWTGGTMNYAYRQQTSQTFITGTAPNSLNYVVYKEQSSNRFITRYFNSTTDRGWFFYTGSTSTFGSSTVGSVVFGFTGTTSNGTERYIRSGLNQSNVFIGSNFYASYPSVCPTTTPTPTLTSTPTQTPTTGGGTPTPTATSSPTPTPTAAIEIFTHGTVLGTCSDYCTTNYQIDVSTPATASYAALTNGGIIYNQGGVAGFVAYAATSTDTATGSFRIAQIDTSGEILAIFICIGGSCEPL